MNRRVIWLSLGLVAWSCGDDDGTPAGARDAMVDTRDASSRDAARPDARVAATDAAVSNATVADAGVTDARVAEASVADARVADARVADAGVQDAGSRASWLIEPGDSVFFVGNSFFNWQDRVLPEWVEAIGQSVQPKFAIETDSHIVPGNNPLSWFFEQDESKDAIASGSYDMFILQGEELEPVDHKEDFHEAVRAYHQAITAKGGKVMLFMTWDFVWNGGPDSDFFKKLSASYDEIGQELNIPVIPVGIIYNDANKAPFSGEQPYFLNGKDLHQTEKGSAVNAYATFSMLTGIDAMGVDFDARNNSNSVDMLSYCAGKSWPRVLERLHD